MTAITEPPVAPPAPGRRAGTWRRGRVIAVFAVLTAVLLLAHPLVPNWPGNAGSLLETFLPWTGLLLVPLLVAALVRRSPSSPSCCRPWSGARPSAAGCRTSGSTAGTSRSFRTT